MKKILLLIMVASALYSSTYTKGNFTKCKEGQVEKQVQTNVTHYSYQAKRYKTICVDIKKEKVKK